MKQTDSMYDLLQSAFGDAFDISAAEKQNDVGALSGEEYEKAVKKEKEIEGKDVKKVKRAWGGVIIYMVVYLILYFISIVTLSLKFLFTSPIFYAVVGVVPVLMWIYSTKFDYFNFHRRKMFWFYVAITNLAMSFCYLIYGVVARALIPEFAKLPVSSLVSMRENMALARLILVLFTVVPFACLMFAVAKQRNNEIFKAAILEFKIVKEMDFRKDTRFSYDMDIVQDLQTGVPRTIKEKDRFLHAVANGTTGTGKTSSCFTCAIAGDLERKQANLDYLKMRTEELIRNNKLKLKTPMRDEDFSLDYFEAVEGAQVEDENYLYEEYNVPELLKKLIRKYQERFGKKKTHSAQEELDRLKKDIKICGITAMAPNASFAEQIYDLALKNGVKNVHRIDPMLGDDGRLKPGFIGFNPLYITPGLSTVDFLIEVSNKATLFADVCQAIFDSSGQQDPYFSSVNKNVTVTAAMMVMLVYPYMPGNKGRQPTPSDMQALINDFSKFKPYREKFVQLYAKKNVNGSVQLIKGRPDVGPFLQSFLDKVDNDFLGEGAEKLWRDAGGLRILIDTFMANPLVRNVLCADKSLDLDKALAEGEIILVNYALELSSDGIALGLFFLLSYIQAVLRRPGNEDTRLPNFFYVDEFPVLLHPKTEVCFSLFRQYRVAMFVAIQSLAQLDKNPSTAYMKQVILGNCAHHFVFGRVGTEEMEYYQELGGTSFKLTVQEGIKETPLKSEKPSVMNDRRETIERDYNFFGSDIRYLDFQEVFVISVVDGSPRSAFRGKVSFLPGSRRIAKASYCVDWKQFYHGLWDIEETGEDAAWEEDEGLSPYGIEQQSNPFEDAKVDLGSDIMSESYRNEEEKEEKGYPFPIGSIVMLDGSDIKYRVCDYHEIEFSSGARPFVTIAEITDDDDDAEVRSIALPLFCECAKTTENINVKSETEEPVSDEAIDNQADDGRPSVLKKDVLDDSQKKDNKEKKMQGTQDETSYGEEEDDGGFWL